MRDHRFVLLAGLIAAMGGCSMTPRYTRPDAPIPATLPSIGMHDQASTAPATGASAEPTVPAGEIPWQAFFTDERLRKVIDIALENNRDLRIAMLNVERARAMYNVQRGDGLPRVNAVAEATRQRLPADLSSSGKAMHTEQYSVSLPMSWEIDLFGRIRSLSDAALQQYFATEYARRGAQIALISTVANTWYALAADREKLELARTTLQAQEESYRLVSRLYEGGLAPELDLFRAQGQVETARADVALYTQRVAQDENALNLLLGGTVPAELLPGDLNSAAPPRELEPGLSSEVLLNRPDVLQAESMLKAAYANIGAARSAFFPRIVLTGAVGTASDELSGLFEAGSRMWLFSPQISMPIFDARVWAAEQVTEVDQQIALAQYERAIQMSFREVADALAVRGTVDQQLAAQESLVRAIAETYRLSRTRYEKGIDSYLSVLDAQRSLYAAQQGLVSVRLARLASQVNLYAALGGGWQAAPTEIEAPTTAPTTGPADAQASSW